MFLLSKLRELRLEKGLSQKELADNISSSNKTIWAYENGVAIPPLDMLIKLADFFGCSIDFIAGREDDFGVIHAAPVHDTGLNPIEEELVENFRKLDYYQQKAISIQTKALAEDNANAANKVIKK